MYKIIHRIGCWASISDGWLHTSWISTNLYSCCTNLVTDSSVPGTTVVIRESPSTSACPTAKLWRGKLKTTDYEERQIEMSKGYGNLASLLRNPNIWTYLDVIATSSKNSGDYVENSRRVIHKHWQSVWAEPTCLEELSQGLKWTSFVGSFQMNRPNSQDMENRKTRNSRMKRLAKAVLNLEHP